MDHIKDLKPVHKELQVYQAPSLEVDKVRPLLLLTVSNNPLDNEYKEMLDLELLMAKHHKQLQQQQ